MTAAAQSIFDERADPGRVLSALLAAAMHAVLFLVLIFGVRWQNRPPEAVQVELWNPPAVAPPVEEPKPVPKAEPAPPPVFVKPEPEVPKPEIVEKKAPPPPKPTPVAKVESRVEPKPAPKPVPVKPIAKVEPFKPRVDETKRFQEELAREQASLAVDRERQRLREQAASDATAARNKSMADWVGKVAAKVRGNVVLPPDIQGNPEAIFDVVQLPNGEVLQVKLRKSSGHRALDDAIERAILKSSPLPKPDRSESAPRAFELKYRPLD
jgi:colicin import membrane protein